MPRVGSSTIRSVGLRPSHLASTVFCWLPPESVQTGFVSFAYFSRRRSAQSRAKARSEPAEDRGRLDERVSRDASAMLRSIEKSMTRPCWRRSSGTSPIPGRHRRGGRAGAQAPAVDLDRAGVCSGRSRRSRARPRSVRRRPGPASATISPLRTTKETSVKSPSRVRRSTFSTTRPGSVGTFGNSASMSRPTIARITDGTVSSSMGFVQTWRPSRITVTRSADRRRSPRGGAR